MNWLRKKIPFQSDDIASKHSSSTKGKSTTDVKLSTDTIQNIAKILIIGETGSGKLTTSKS
jgi:type IV secretory pathway ATPase VirB11/archaellum biosynthesis ATPase